MSEVKTTTTWAESLMRAEYRGTPIYITALTLVVPYLIVSLILRDPASSSSRLYRLALAPIALWSMWIMYDTYIMAKPDDVQLFELSVLCTLSVNLRYALSTTPPSFHPLPGGRSPPLDFFRTRAFDVMASEFRHINMPPNPPLPPSPRGYLRAVMSHLVGFMAWTSAMDLVLYPGYMLDPAGVGSPTRLSLAGDYTISLPAYCASGNASIVTALGCWVWFAVAVALAVLFAMQGTYHLFAFLGIASGLYADEEWPAFMDRPWVADSLNDLWGKRYHQMLRDIFLLWAKPFSTLPRPVHLLSIFLASAVFHALVYKPMTGSLILQPYMMFYLTQGLGCVAERAFYKRTGRRVGGWSGRLWMILVLLGTGYPMVNEYYRMGWVGSMRGPLHTGGFSPAAWLAYALGAGPVPRAQA